MDASLLDRYPLLRDLPVAERERLLAMGKRVSIPVGTLVFDEQQACQGFPLVLSGSIRVIKAAASGRELLLYRVGAGESCILTSSCLLGHTRYLARGIAEENLEMLFLPATAFHQWFSQHEAFRRYVFELFSERLTDLMELISAVAFQKLDQRLAALLLQKGRSLQSTHQALADELGCAREIVSRLLKGFAEQGWVKLGRESIEVLNSTALKKLL